MIKYFIAKKESFMGHLGWGIVFSGFPILCGAPAIEGILVATLIGIGWELGSFSATNGKWKSNLLDIIPWILGGFTGWGIASWYLWTM